MIRKTLLSLGWLAGVTLARAGPPYVTDDPEPVAYRHWEINVGSQYAHSGEGATGTLPYAEVNYGALPDLQLHLLTSVTFSAPSGASRQSGYGDTELGAKYRLVGEAEGIPQVAVFPAVELPTGDSARGLGSGHTQVFLPVWLQKSFGTWTTYGGAGYWINPGAGNRNWWFTGWLIQKQVSPGLTVGAEIFHETAQNDSAGAATKMNIGLIWDLDETHHVLASAGPTLQGPSGYQVYLAFQLTFGPGK
jgi:Putative MetA-pathway of phenol degradation